MRTYVKIYFDWKEVTETLSDAEKGRLIDAIITYAESGETEQLSGAEKHVFPTFRAQIKRDIADYDASAENGKKGGRPKKIQVSEENLNDFRLPTNNLKNQDKDKEEDKDKEKEKEVIKNPPISPRARNTAFEKFWSAYPNKKSKGDAEKAFTRALKKTDLETILAALEKHKTSRQWQEDNGRFIPYPATWLNQERWSDVLEVAAPMHTLAPTAF